MKLLNYESNGFFDEVFDGQGTVRPHYKMFLDRLSSLSNNEYHKCRDTVDQSFIKQGITFNVYSDSAGTEKIFPFDLFPRIIPDSEWKKIEEGLTQRIVALNLFLNDIYGEQKIIKDRIINEYYIKSCKYFRPELIGVKPPKGIYIHVCGSDLVRGADGSYYVLEDNGRCPSGVSYLLENRQAMKRVFPRFFEHAKVRSVRDYPKKLKNVLRHIAPEGVENPTVAVLTPGCYNSAYYEHCYLARQMGVRIVEGQDLVVQDGCVYMRTVNGPERIDVLYRRVDDDFLDPTVFRPESVLGVPGIVDVYRKGRVGLANALGTGVADDKVIYCFVPRMIKYYLDQEPILPNVETYLAEEDNNLEYILENIADLVVKPANESGGYGILIGPKATKTELEEYKEKLKENPREFIAQTTVQLSRHPTWCDEDFEGRHIDLRPYILYGDDIKIIPGGLTRVALKKGSLVVNSSQGGGSKDTWVLKGDE